MSKVGKFILVDNHRSITLNAHLLVFYELDIKVSKLMERHTDSIIACVVDSQVEVARR